MRAVLVTIADAANRDGEHAHPGVASMVEGSGYSRSTVMAALVRLVGEGWIVIEEEGRGRGHATVYAVVMEKVRSSDVSSDQKGPTERPERSDPEVEKVQSGDAAPITPTVNPNGCNAVVVPIGTPRGVDTRSAVDDLCEQLATAIERQGGTKPKISAPWRRDMRLLIERGPLDVDDPQPLSAEKIGRAIEFTFTRLAERGADGFCWADQIQSPSGLRRKWRRLVAAGVKLQQQRRGRGADAVAAAAARLESGESLLGLFGGQPTKEAENHA